MKYVQTLSLIGTGLSRTLPEVMASLQSIASLFTDLSGTANESVFLALVGSFTVVEPWKLYQFHFVF